MSRNWPTVKLGNVLTPSSREEAVDATKEYRLLGVRLEGRGPFLREVVSGTQTSATKLFRVEKGDFIYSRLFACRGAFGVISEELDGCYVSSEFPMFLPVPGMVDFDFLRYWFQLPTVIALVDEDCSGSTPLTRNRFKEQFFLALEIPLPPLAEQRRIVARIEELAAKIEEARELRQQAQGEAEVLLGCAVSRLCCSSNWATMTVGELVGVDSLRNGRSVKPTGDYGEVRCLTLSAVRGGRIDLRDSKVVPMTREEAEPFLVNKGDVFVVRGNGSKNLCGMAGLVSEDTDSVIFPDLFIRIPIPVQVMLPEFFVAVWNSATTREVIEDKAKTTSGIWKINQGHIISTVIQVPPLSEQRRIVADLDDLQKQADALKVLQAETSTELAALMPSILDKAFRGEM
jgi:type I restriction enzyme S subunit